MFNNALTYLFYLYDKFIVFVFDTCDFGGGLTIGWIIMSVFVFNIIITNLLAVPRASEGLSVYNTKKYWTK